MIGKIRKRNPLHLSNCGKRGNIFGLVHYEPYFETTRKAQLIMYQKQKAVQAEFHLETAFAS